MCVQADDNDGDFDLGGDDEDRYPSCSSNQPSIALIQLCLSFAILFSILEQLRAKRVAEMRVEHDKRMKLKALGHGCRSA